MKQIQESTHQELYVPKRQYEKPNMEVIELERQIPLLSGSKFPTAGSLEKQDL